MKVLLTGGDGFIARSLAEAFKDEYVVHAANRKNLDLLNHQAVLDYLKKHNFDVVIHTATYDAAPACSTKDPTKVLESNLKMFFNIARAREYFGKLIYFGSGAEFSREHWIPKMNESYFDQHVPEDQYGFSKYLMTKFTQTSLSFYNLRLFGLFGKYDDWRYRFIPSACRNAVLDLPLTIKKNGIFDFMYIDDLVAIVKIFIQNKPRNHVYNICTGTTYDLRTLAEKIKIISGKNLEILTTEPGVNKEYSGDNAALIQEFPGIKFTKIDEAITKLYHWYQLNQHHITKTI